jgi:hypothetical protein
MKNLLFTLNDKTKRSIGNRIGINTNELVELDAEDIDRHIERKIGKKLKSEPERDIRLIGRGSVYMFLLRLIGTKEIDAKLSKI